MKLGRLYNTLETVEKPFCQKLAIVGWSEFLKCLGWFVFLEGIPTYPTFCSLSYCISSPKVRYLFYVMYHAIE
jgi:hypothetical protein